MLTSSLIKEQVLNNFFSIDPSSPGTPPVSLAEAKSHLVVDFTDDDTYITNLISQCIDAIEQYCAVAITPKTITLIADIVREFELPYGPVTTFTSASLKTDINTYTAMTANSAYEVDSSLQFPRFIPYTCGRIKLIYTVGYGTNLPNGLKLAILNEIAFRYENRGDGTNRYAQQNVGVSEGSQALANPYRRLAWL